MTQTNKGYAGAEWVRSCRCKEISEFGEKVADILGAVFRGIYHLDPHSPSFRKIDWARDDYILFCIHNELATWDYNKLTELVIACHDECVRFSVSGKSNGYLELQFHKREGREGNMFERHPTIEEAIANWRGMKGEADAGQNQKGK